MGQADPKLASSAAMTAQALSFTSSAFAQMVYDSDTGDLIATFRDGETYIYNLPQDVVDAWMAAGSVGGFYNANIRGQFSFAHYDANRDQFGN